VKASRTTTGAVVGCLAVAAAGGALLLWPGAGPGTTASAGTPRSGPPKLSVSGAYVREPASPDVAAAYFTVRNSGGVDQLTRVESSTPGTAELHASTGSKMTGLVEPRIPAGGTLDFQPGAYHVMLVGPGPLKAGDHVRLTLVFAASAPISVDAPVVGISEAAPTP
jgi:copper(I)-binding protein